MMWVISGSSRMRTGNGPSGFMILPGGSITINGKTMKNLGPDPIPVEVLEDAGQDIGWRAAPQPKEPQP